ncbi:META domain-containing protein [Flavobacterium sp.]|uniref:META domain-containing protein n=1 Tax=Flavobacterium sp. TaxID=239 RepID=UPI0039E7263C
MNRLILLLIAAAGTLVSCDAKKSATDAVEADPASLNGSWELTYMTRTRQEVNYLYPDKKPFLSFNTKESKVSGSTGCNSFTGSISSMSDGEIRFDAENLAMTKMFCEGEGEGVFLQNMKMVDKFNFSDDGKTLHLISGDIDAMRFTKR